MDGLKIGGIFYGGDIQKAMQESHTIVMDSAKEVFKNDCLGDEAIRTIQTGLECYENALIDRLKNITKESYFSRGKR